MPLTDVVVRKAKPSGKTYKVSDERGPKIEQLREFRPSRTCAAYLAFSSASTA